MQVRKAVMNPLLLLQVLTMYINHIWAANVTEIGREPHNKDTFYLQPIFKARDSPYVDALHRMHNKFPREDYQVLGMEISDIRMNAILRKTSHRTSRSTLLRTYPNRVTYVASNKGKMARILFIFCEIYPNCNPNIFEKLRNL